MLILEGERAVQHLAYTPDGRDVVSATGNRVCLWDLQTGTVRRQLPISSNRFGGIALSPDGAYLALGQPLNQAGSPLVRPPNGELIDVFHLPSEELRLSLGPGLRSQRHLLFPDSKSVVVGSHVVCSRTT